MGWEWAAREMRGRKNGPGASRIQGQEGAGLGPRQEAEEEAEPLGIALGASCLWDTVPSRLETRLQVLSLDPCRNVLPGQAEGCEGGGFASRTGCGGAGCPRGGVKCFQVLGEEAGGERLGGRSEPRSGCQTFLSSSPPHPPAHPAPFVS